MMLSYIPVVNNILTIRLGVDVLLQGEQYRFRKENGRD
jgi:hypothetical protein